MSIAVTSIPIQLLAHANTILANQCLTYDETLAFNPVNALGQKVFHNVYDPVGNLTNRLDGAGNTVNYRYDELDRLVARDGFNHETHETHEKFEYDAAGNLLMASNVVARESFTYDVMDRLATASTTLRQDVAYTAAYSYNAGGLVTNLVFGRAGSPILPQIRRTYDADGRPATVSDWLGHTWTFAWDGAGKPTGMIAPGGITATNHYDAAGRLAAWRVGDLAGRAISRDAAGLKTREDITAGTVPTPQKVRYAENTFDAADRLTSAQVRYGSHTNAPTQETYLYDNNGALTNLVSGINAVFAASYNPLGQLATLKTSHWPLATNHFQYDALGNRLVAGSVVWIPDHADPLKRPLIEADAATGAPIRYYLWAPGRLLGFIDAASGTLTVAHCDDYGSVIALTAADGTPLHTAHYGPNGQNWGTIGHNPTPFAWLGGHGVQRVAVSDHLGSLYLTRYRLYAASLNRFLSSDPLGLAGGLNLYAYALGDPLTYIDPLGLKADGMWYDQASDWLRNITETAKDYYNDTLPWGAAGAVNTLIDFATGAGHAPAAIGHLGEGTGQFAADPSWRNAGGVVSDVLIAGAVLTATAAALPSVSGSAAVAAASKAAKNEPKLLPAPKPTATLTQQRLEHIVERHWATSGATSAGKFAPGTTARSLRDMVNETVGRGVARPNTRGRSGQIYELDIGRKIGTDMGGAATSRLRVVVDTGGNVVTAFPY